MRYLILCLAILLAPWARAQRPALFQDFDLETAQDKAKTEARFVLLDAMTSWCGPCKRMDVTTWMDASVTGWVAQHAIAIQLDMDEHSRVKDQLGISAYPTMVLFRADGTEFDRVIGLRTPTEMMHWLEGAMVGEREVDRMRARLAELLASGEPRTLERIQLAQQAADLEAWAEASDLVLWLWDRAGAEDSEQQALQQWKTGSGRFLTGDVAARVPDGRSGLSTRRELRQLALAGAESKWLRDEWILLNHALAEEDRTAVWASGLAGTPEGRAVLQQHEAEVFELLLERGLWAAAGQSLCDPLQHLRFLGEHLGAYDLDPEGNASSSEGAIPAIPMGGMAPAAAAPHTSESMPMIPLEGMQPAKRTKPETLPAVPLQGMVPAKPQPPNHESVPMIPVQGVPPATGSGATEPKVVPAIPMGGMAPARPTTPEGIAEEIAEEIAREVRARLTHELRRNAARRYGALLAADRLGDAEAVASLALHYANDDMARAALLECAMRAGKLGSRNEVHLAWLDEIARGAGR